MPSGLVDIAGQVGPILKRIAVDVPTARGDQFVQHHRLRGCDDLRQRCGHLMAPHCPALRNLVQDIAPPLQPHLGNQRFFGHPRCATDLDVKRIECKERAALCHRRQHGRAKAQRVAPLDDSSTGRQIIGPVHRGRTTLSR